MPTYQYVCDKCGHEFDTFQSIKDAALSVCPKDKCAKKVWGKGKVKRAIGAGAGLIFKGSGFYITDYRSDSYKEAAKKDTASSGSTSSSDSGSKAASTSSDSKPAAKPAEKKPAKTKE